MPLCDKQLGKKKKKIDENPDEMKASPQLADHNFVKRVSLTKEERTKALQKLITKINTAQ